jgi:WD40 repeat protein
MRTFSYVLDKTPLQLYTAGLSFSPSRSVFRKLFSVHASKGVKVTTQIRDEWDACIQALEGHTDTISSVVFSPDGSRVASGSWDQTVRVWDVQTGQCEQALNGHTGRISSVVFSPDGSRVASSSYDRTVRVWDVQTGQCEQALNGHICGINSVVFSPDGSRVASGSWDYMVRVWDVASTGQLLYYDSGTSTPKIYFSDDNTKIMVNGAPLSISSQKSFLGTKAGSLQSQSNISSSTLGCEDSWVTLSSARILWLPSEYRPGVQASYGDTIVVGSKNGRVTFVRCTLPDSSSPW